MIWLIMHSVIVLPHHYALSFIRAFSPHYCWSTNNHIIDKFLCNLNVSWPCRPIIGNRNIPAICTMYKDNPSPHLHYAWTAWMPWRCLSCSCTYLWYDTFIQADYPTLAIIDAWCRRQKTKDQKKDRPHSPPDFLLDNSLPDALLLLLVCIFFAVTCVGQ